MGDFAIFSDLVYMLLANLSFTLHLINAIKMEWSTLQVKKYTLPFGIIDDHDLYVTQHILNQRALKKMTCGQVDECEEVIFHFLSDSSSPTGLFS